MKHTSQIVHRSVTRKLPTAVAGNGVYIEDDKGQRYLDACGGAAVSCLGYSHPAPIAAIRKQVDELAYIHSSFFTSAIAEQLADKLVSMAPDPLNHVILLSGGSEAVETAIKLARQYFVERDELERKHFICRQQSYHGYTLGALSIGNNPKRRKPYAPLLHADHSISACYPYRHQRENETEIEYGLRVANELEVKVNELGAENVIGFIAESVGGATAGVLPPVPGYLKRVREICDQYNILLIFDEVMCGSGRTGTFLACDHDQVTPDIVTLAKSLGAGYQPIAATLCTEAIYEAVRGGSGALMNGHTYMGHSLGCAASLAVLETIESENLLDNVKDKGHKLITNLRSQLTSHPNVGDIRGRGLFIGVEFVLDQSRKTPFDSKLQFSSVLKHTSEENGLMCYTGNGTADGVSGDHVLLAPAYIIDDNIVDEIVDKLSLSIRQTADKVNQSRA